MNWEPTWVTFRVNSQVNPVWRDCNLWLANGLAETAPRRARKMTGLEKCMVNYKFSKIEKTNDWKVKNEEIFFEIRDCPIRVWSCVWMKIKSFPWDHIYIAPLPILLTILSLFSPLQPRHGIHISTLSTHDIWRDLTHHCHSSIRREVVLVLFDQLSGWSEGCWVGIWRVW